MNGQEYTLEYIGNNIRKMRYRRGFTQVQVAEAIHVTPGSISNLENGRICVTLSNMIGIADLLNVSLDELVGRSEPDVCPEAVIGELLQEISRLSADDQKRLTRALRAFRE